MKERAILITVGFDSMRSLGGGDDLEGFSAELKDLSESAGLSVCENLIRRQKTPNASIYLGRGQAEELCLLVRKHKADVVVFGGNLSGSQQRNLEEIIGTKTIDRTQLILDIFARRAKSSEGKLQVELAQLKYLLPRLSGKGIYLSRLGGGVGTRGPGEQKLEVDRRKIRDRVTHLSDELGRLRQRHLRGITQKKDKALPLVALIGYTNAGKSSLFNVLTDSQVDVKHKLFSTLDTTTRLLPLPGNLQALLVDTVGFVRDLPHHLVESFKATLEETVQADLLIHVIDSSRPDIRLVQEAVAKVLAELGSAREKNTIRVFNKIDLLTSQRRAELEQQESAGDTVLSSTFTGEGMSQILEKIAARLSLERFRREFFVPENRLGLAEFLYRETAVLEREDKAEGSRFAVMLTSKTEKIFEAMLRRGE